MLRHPRRRFVSLLCALSAVVMGCGTGGTGPKNDDEHECEVQADCGEGYSRVCIDHACSDELPENAVRPVIIELNTQAVRQAKSFRLWAVHTSKPNGDTVTCDELKSLENPTAVLLDGKTYNLTVEPAQQSRTGTGDFSKTGIQLNGTERLVYVAAYAKPFGGEVGAEGDAIAGNCVSVATVAAGADIVVELP